MLQDHLGYMLEHSLIEEMAQVAKIRETTTDEIVVNVGDQLQMIPIVIEGSIKISRENDNGEEILLYYIEGGDTCYGKGWLFYGGNEDYNVEPCDCNLNSDFDGSLFLKEND